MKLKRKINFDVCTFCNHACDFCSNPDKRTKKAKTNYADFVKAMDNVLQYVETDELGLSAKGEVLLNNDLESIISHCKNIYNIPYIYISSNGALMDKSRAISLIESGLDSIKFSINAIDSINYKKVHNRDDFEKVIQNFSTLLKLKKEKFPHLKLLISSVLTPCNTQNPQEAFGEIFGEDSKLINNVLPYQRTITQKEHISTGGGIIESPHNSTSQFSTLEPLPKPLCSTPFNEIWINADCSLILCCKDYFDSINFGSLLTHDFLDIYHSQTFEEIKQMQQYGIFPQYHLCKQCLGV